MTKNIRARKNGVRIHFNVAQYRLQLRFASIRTNGFYLLFQRSCCPVRAERNEVKRNEVEVFERVKRLPLILSGFRRKLYRKIVAVRKNMIFNNCCFVVFLQSIY